MSTPPVVFRPGDDASSSALALFMAECRHVTGLPLPDYAALQEWALSDATAFWSTFLRWSGILTEGSATPVLHGTDVETARFFPALRLNFAENLLRPLSPDDGDWRAIAAVDETGAIVRLNRRELRARVASAASHLHRLGLEPGDRVAAVVRNNADTAVMALACASIGVAWSAVSPDMGTDVVLSRFSQIEPRVLVAHGAWMLQGQARDLTARVAEIVAGLPTVRTVIALDAEAAAARLPVAIEDYSTWDAAAEVRAFARFPFDHPLYVMFSSGTTGMPKCMVHGAGGTLLEHLKELRLHSGLGPADALLFQTNCAWMMWHWMLSGLGVGAEVVLFDGSVSYPTPDRLLRTADALQVTHLGTNPTYLQFLRDTGSTPSADLSFSRLRAVLSTGSVLSEELYDWVDAAIAHVPLQSISGGTDIIGCFVLGNPMLPVFRGESQCVSLGLDARVMTDEGLRRTGLGELVCAAPFPSRPLYFIGDADKHRYHDAYFAQHPGLWTHGDIVELTDRGTARVLGRSDGTLNVRGVRIGPAEIHAIVLGLPEVAQALAVEQRWPQEPGGSRIALLLVLKEGVTLDRPLTLRLKRELATRASANHVPGLVVQVTELPATFNGKVSARAARDALNGVAVANRAALRNPAVLEQLAGFAPTPGRPAA